MTSASLDLKELDFESFLDTSFDEFQGFPWSGAATQDAGPSSADVFATNLPAPTESPSQAELACNTATAQPPYLASVPQHHRLLNDRGLAYTMPDLTTDAQQSGQPPFAGLLAAQLSFASSEPRAATPDSSGQQGMKERLSSSGSGDLSGKGKNILSLAERNKQAQRRHRQRQRDRLETLEAQVRKLSEEKQTLVAEKAALAGQAAVLTQVLQTRDEQLQQIQPASQSPASVVKEEPDEALSRKESAVSSGLADSLAAVLTLTVREDHKIQLKPEDVKAMTPQEVTRVWAEYMSALMKQLSAVSGSNPETVNKTEGRMAQLLQEVLVLLMRYALGDLHKMKQFVVGRASEAKPRVGLENSEMWRAAARNLELSPPQRTALCQLRRLFMQKHEALILQRRDAMTALQHAIPSAASSHDMAQQFLTAEEAMERMHENLRMENQLIVDLIYTLFIKIVSPVQAAKCMVQSFPWYPDSLCILTWIAAEAGDTQAMELLQIAQHSEQGSAGETLSPSQSL